MARNNRRVVWLCVAALGGGMAGLGQDYSLLWPSNVTMTECESATRCDAQWTFHGMKGLGGASSGHSSHSRSPLVGPKDFVIERKDTRGPTVGLTARYTGHVTGDVVEGNVDWTWHGHWNEATAHGHWFAGLNDADLKEALNRYKSQGTAGTSGNTSTNNASGPQLGAVPDGSYQRDGRLSRPKQRLR
jgi:hypothetical protein